MSSVKYFLWISLFLFVSCKNADSQKWTDEQIWKLEWRMVENSIYENYELAALQFDSLQSITSELDPNFIKTGLEVKHLLGKNAEVSEMLQQLDEEALKKVCLEEWTSEYNICDGQSEATVGNESLKLELIKMYLNDQNSRSNLMNELLEKYNLNKEEVIIDASMSITDARNRDRLKEIIEEHGFPTADLVGKKAMQGVFMIIQHADRDKEWQKLQLSNIEKAVKNGDMDGQSYAYLYDRIKINSGEQQLYGTQFANVDPINKTTELAPTEDIENLNARRMEIGMMPVETYKRIVLSRF
ncbi:MAG: hypothetical protein HKN68_13255 [Saprospiraceae bacterium]|nr:hypothetical protein [Saprospiraceae bacterium]